MLMTDFPDNIQQALDQLPITNLEMEKALTETQGAELLMRMMAPQELDRLATVLYYGFRSGFGEVISKQVQGGQAQFSVVQDAVIRELKSAEEDLGIKEIDKKFNVADFCGKIFENFPRQ